MKRINVPVVLTLPPSLSPYLSPLSSLPISLPSPPPLPPSQTEIFQQAVPDDIMTHYREYIFFPVDLGKIKEVRVWLTSSTSISSLLM